MPAGTVAAMALPSETACWADWGDEPGADRAAVDRKELDLCSVIPCVKA